MVPSGACVEEAAEAYGEDKATIETVFQTSQAQRPVTCVVAGEEQAADGGHGNCDPVQEDHMGEAKSECAGGDDGFIAAEQRAIPGKQECAVEHFLRPYRQHRIEYHDQQPEARFLKRQAEECLWPEPYGQRHDNRREDRKTQEDGSQLATYVMRLRLFASDREKRHDSSHPDEPEQDARAAEFEDEKRATEIEGSEFDGEAEERHVLQVWHRTAAAAIASF